MSLSSRTRISLEKLCREPKTRTNTIELYEKAQAKTNAGSEFDLGAFRGALLPICALIASEKLCNGDISEKQAQVASCLQPSDFRNALGRVRAALSSTYHPSGRTLDFKSLVDSYGLSENILMSAREVEDEASGRSLFGLAADFEAPATRCAIFYWVGTCAKVIPAGTCQALLDDYAFNKKEFNRIYSILEERCRDLQERIVRREEVAALRRKSMKRMDSVSPTKPVVLTPGSTAMRPPRRCVLLSTPPLKRQTEDAQCSESSPSKRLRRNDGSPHRVHDIAQRLELVSMNSAEAEALEWDASSASSEDHVPACGIHRRLFLDRKPWHELDSRFKNYLRGFSPAHPIR